MFSFSDTIMVLGVKDKVYSFDGKSYPCTFVNLVNGSRVISVRLSSHFSDDDGVLEALRNKIADEFCRCLAYFELSYVFDRKEGRFSWRLVISQLSLA